MHRRSLLAVGTSIAVAGCLSDDDSESGTDETDGEGVDTDTTADNPARTPSGRRTLTPTQRSTIAACEVTRVREVVADDADVEPLPRVTSISPHDSDFLRVDVTTEWRTDDWGTAISISPTDRLGVDGVPSSATEPFAELDGFQSALSDAVLFGDVKIESEQPLYEELRAAIETTYRGFGIGDAVYLEHEGDLVRLFSRESGGSPENQTRAVYFHSAEELRRLTDNERDETPAEAAPVDC